MDVEVLLEKAAGVVESVLGSNPDAASLDHATLGRVIEQTLATGCDFRVLWIPGGPVQSLMLHSVHSFWASNSTEADDTPEFFQQLGRDKLVIAYLAASGAGDYQYLVGGNSGSWRNAPEKYQRLGLWNATKIAATRHMQITGDLPKGSLPPKPAGCVVLVASVICLAASVVVSCGMLLLQM